MINLALEVAAKAHEGQKRKGTDIPYISHPYAVGMMLARNGLGQDLICAGILHDTVEDTKITLQNIAELFGERVTSIVAACSEPDKKLSWHERKKHTIELLKGAPLEVLQVTCADKLHNIMTIAREYEVMADSVWDRFSKGREDQKWYYTSLVQSFRNGLDNPEDKIPFLKEFEMTVEKVFS